MELKIQYWSFKLSCWREIDFNISCIRRFLVNMHKWYRKSNIQVLIHDPLKWGVYEEFTNGNRGKLFYFFCNVFYVLILCTPNEESLICDPYYIISSLKFGCDCTCTSWKEPNWIDTKCYFDTLNVKIAELSTIFHYKYLLIILCISMYSFLRYQF